MRFLSLFAGIGGFDLGLERAGMTCVGQVEIDDYCTAILAKHWPDVPRWGDIRDVDVQELISKCGSIDLICGGFPCQDISVAGKGAGIEGARSGLWWEMWRIIQGIKPRWLFIENVPAFRTRGADIVLPLLAKHSYTVEPSVVGVRHLGGSHKRDRISIVAYRDGDGLDRIGIGEVLNGERPTSWDDVDRRCSAESMGDTNGDTIREQSGRGRRQNRTTKTSESGRSGDMEHADSGRLQGDWTERTESDRGKEIAAAPPTVKGGSSDLADSNREHGTASTVERRREMVVASEISTESGSDSDRCQGVDDTKKPRLEGEGQGLFAFPAPPGCEQYDWEEPRTTESRMGTSIDGLPIKLALRGIGNAFCPYQAEIYGRSIMRIDKRLKE